VGEELPQRDPIEAADNLRARWIDAGMTIEEAGDRAYYEPATDVVRVPARTQWSTTGS